MVCGEPPEWCDAASVGLDNLHATILDMSATARLKAQHQAGAVPALGSSVSVHPGLRTPCHTQLGCDNWSLVLGFQPVAGSPRAVVSNTLLIAALSLFLAGCADLEPDAPVKTRLLAPADTRPTHDLAPVTKQPEAPAKPAPPAPQPVQRVSEPKPPPATATKGAEKLVAPSAPAPVRVSERPRPRLIRPLRKRQ